jgi:hypothetical protein
MARELLEAPYVPIWRALAALICRRSVRAFGARTSSTDRRFCDSAASGLEEFDHVSRVMRHLAGARYLREDDRDRPEDLVRFAEARLNQSSRFRHLSGSSRASSSRRIWRRTACSFT